MPDFITISELSRRYHVAPRKISDLFYSRTLADDVCPIISGRRVVPQSYIPEVERVLRERGLIQEVASCNS